MKTKPEKFSWKKRLQSFQYAFNGLKMLIREEHSARIHIVIAVCVLAAGLVFKISGSEWIAVALSIGMVIALETVNSAIENLADFVSPEKHAKIKKIKDLSAGAVLLGAMAAVAVGLIVFLPEIF
ncbi:MAG: diacylglycerol kinase family protein [Dysgonamonadaceae bacterium]|jgi:diacylglycerol kinase|nr:diacylglycerol kinase family protein [Dysgonamonadaceae bacterium]